MGLTWNWGFAVINKPTKTRCMSRFHTISPGKIGTGLMPRPATARLDTKELGQNRIGGQKMPKGPMMLMISDDFLMTLIKAQKPVLTSFRVILKQHPAKIGDLSIAIPEVQNGAEGEVAQPKGSRVTKATLHARICASYHLVIKHSNGHSTV